MLICRMRFNFILAVVLTSLLFPGCATSNKKDKSVATIRVFLELSPSSTIPSEQVPIYRADPFLLKVAKDPFLNEAYVKRASVIPTTGGFALLIEFDDQGSARLEQITAMNPGKHLAISSAFGPKLSQVRWLAAPLVNHRVSNGQLGFTPDCTQAEAIQIADGLNNVVANAKKKSMFK
jgi:hypothetical protein